jgi:putative ABC transport system permease protein
MLKNFLTIAFRNLRKYKGFSAINIIGLALGITSSLLILLWVLDERSMDALPAKGDRLYIVYDRTITNGKTDAQLFTPGLLADELKKNFPDIEAACGYGWLTPSTFSVGNKILKEDANHAGADFFTLFSYPLLEGNARTALSTPLSMAISRKMANDFFGSPKAAIGKTIRYENQKDFTVSAVFEDLSSHVSERINCLMNWDAFLRENEWIKQWGNNGPSTYILLSPGADPERVRKSMTRFLDSYVKPGPSFREELGIQLFRDRYLHSHFVNGYPDGGRIEYVQLFSLIACFIVVIACINFMNLTTARSTKRAKEIGVRKVLGAARGLLISQFMAEAILLAGLASLLALVLVNFLIPSFNQLTGKDIRLPYNRWGFWCMLTGLALVTGLFSGSYPALFLSSFNPIRVLKGYLKSGLGAVWFRKGLVVFQFVLSILLILSTLLISEQVRYIQTKDLGYDRENLLYVNLDGDLPAKYEVFKSAAAAVPGIGGVSEMSESPTEMVNYTQDMDWEGKDPNYIPQFAQAAVGYDFARTMKIQLLQGRDFSKDFPSDSNGYIINETALARIGYKNPIGRTISFWSKKGVIIGVVKDFHFQSLHDPIRPLILREGAYTNYGIALVRTLPGQTRQAIAGLAKLCKELNPKFPFTFQFSEGEYTKLYKSEQITGRLSMLFAILAIFISCMGLFGLSIFSAEQRTKEIGIRKVLGAGITSLFTLLSTEFLTLVGIAFLIAAPMGWWVMQEWLRHFAYRMSINWWLFGVAGLLSIVIALVTVSYQAVRVALANPVKSLHAE